MLASAVPVTEIAENASTSTREKIQQLQNSMLELRCDMPEAEHFFAPGMYGRRFEMPAGMLVVGKIHRHAHLMMVLKGRAHVVTEHGAGVVEAGHVSVSQPGAKRAVYAFEDTVFMTVHHNPSDTENLDEIENTHIETEGFDLEFHSAVKGALT